jgi:hypothetical protein
VPSPANNIPPIKSKFLAIFTVALKTFLMALGLSLLKFEIVLWSGTSPLISQISYIFLFASFSKPWEERILFKYP